MVTRNVGGGNIHRPKAGTVVHPMQKLTPEPHEGNGAMVRPEADSNRYACNIRQDFAEQSDGAAEV